MPTQRLRSRFARWLPWRELRSIPPGITVALLSLGANAFQPLITDDTGTQGAGGNQLELSVNQSRTTTSDWTDRVTGLPAVYTRGVSETADLFIGAGYLRLRPAGGDDTPSGATNSTLGGKWRFLDTTADGTSAAVKLELLMPVTRHAEDRGLGSATLGGNLTAIVSQDLPFGAIHLNLGAGRRRRSHGSPDAIPVRLSAAPVWQVNHQWRLALDLGMESVSSEGQRLRTRFGELGTIWSPNEDLDLALGVIRTADNQAPTTRALVVTAGLSWRFR